MNKFDPSYKEFVIPLQQYAVSRFLADEVRTARVTVYMENRIEYQAVQIMVSAVVAALSKEVETTIPITWVDAVKQRIHRSPRLFRLLDSFRPGWLAYNTMRYRATATFTDLEIPPPVRNRLAIRYSSEWL